MARKATMKEEAGNKPSMAVRYWLNEINDARKRDKDYRKEGKRIVEIYSGKKKEQIPFNILYSNTETLLPALYSSVFIFGMNQAKYDSLPPDLKKVIDDNSGAALAQQAGKIWDNSQAAGRKAAQDRGNVFYTIPGSELDNWVKASASLNDDWVADMDKRGLPGKQMLQDARDLLKKYATK